MTLERTTACIVALPLALTLGACLRKPPRAEGQWPLSRAELASSAPADSPGEADYRRYCLSCHGDDGRGNGGTTGADLTAPGGPLTKPDDLLVVSVRDGRRGAIGVMPPHGRLLDDAAIRGVLAYVRARFGAGIVPAAIDAGLDASMPTAP